VSSVLIEEKVAGASASELQNETALPTVAVWTEAPGIRIRLAPQRGPPRIIQDCTHGTRLVRDHPLVANHGDDGEEGKRSAPWLWTHPSSVVHGGQVSATHMQLPRVRLLQICLDGVVARIVSNILCTNYILYS
jgi:hypothetical protein